MVAAIGNSGDRSYTTSRFVDVRDFGAIATGGDANGVVNSVAFQAAVDYLAGLNGGVVYIPACREDGTNGYYLTHPVWINGDQIEIKGSSDRASVLKSRGPAIVVNKNPIYWTTRKLWVDTGTVDHIRTLPAGTAWRGVWDPDTIYALDDLVVYNDVTYRMVLSPGTTTVAPSTDTEPDYWQPFTDQNGTWIIDDSRYRTDLARLRADGPSGGEFPADLAGDNPLEGGSEYAEQAFAFRTRGRALARFPYQPLATGNDRPGPNDAVVGSWETHDQATFEFIFYWHGGNLHGGIAGCAGLNSPDPWLLAGSYDTGELIFSFAMTDDDLVQKSILWAKIAAPGSVGLHRVCFQVDLTGTGPKVNAYLNESEVTVSFTYPDNTGYTQGSNLTIGERWNRFARWEGADFTLGSASYYVGSAPGEDFNPAASFPDLSIIACTVYTSLRYQQRSAGQAQIRIGTGNPYSDTDVMGSVGQFNTVRTTSLGCLYNEYATFPITAPQTAVGLGSYSKNNFVWGYMCPDGIGAGNAPAVVDTRLSSFKTSNPDSTGSAYSCDILIGKYLMLRIKDIATTGFHYCSLGAMNAAAVYSLFVDDCELFSMVHICNGLTSFRKIQFGYVPKCIIRMSGAQLFLDDFLVKEPSGNAEGGIMDFAGSSLSAGITIRNGTVNWETETNPCRIAMIYTQKRAYHSNTKINLENVIFGETAGIPTFYLDDFIEQLDHPAYIDVRRCGLPGRSPIMWVRGKDWRGKVEIGFENWFEDQVVQLPSYEDANYTTNRLKTVIHEQWSLPPGGGFKAAGHEVAPNDPPEGGVALWGVKVGGIEGTATPPVWRPLALSPSFRKHAISANVGPALHVRCSLPWPAASTTPLAMTCLTSPWASALLAHLLTGAAAFTRTHSQFSWQSYLPYFGSNNTVDSKYSLLHTGVLANATTWSAAASSVKSNSGNIAVTGRDHGWTGIDFRRRVGFSAGIGSETTRPRIFAGKTAPVDLEFWDTTASTSFNIPAGALLFAGAPKEGAFVHYAMDKILDHVAGGSALGLSGPWYLGLSTTPIALDGTGVNEPSGGSYARVAVALNADNWQRLGASPSNVWANAIDIEWPSPTGPWGECPYLFASDAPTGGNVVWRAPLNQTVTVAAGDSAVILYANALQIQA